MERQPRQCPSCQTWCGPNTPYCHCQPQLSEQGDIKEENKEPKECPKCSGSSGICRDCAKLP